MYKMQNVKDFLEYVEDRYINEKPSMLSRLKGVFIRTFRSDYSSSLLGGQRTCNTISFYFDLDKEDIMILYKKYKRIYEDMIIKDREGRKNRLQRQLEIIKEELEEMKDV